MLHGHGVVAFGTVSHVFDVRLGTGPPHAVHFLAGVAGGLCFLDCSAVHDAPAPQDHVVRAVLAHLQPGGFLLNTWGSHGQQRQSETVHGSALLQQGNGFFAKRAVVVNQGNFLAFELVPTTFFFGDGLHDGVSGHPVGTSNGEVPLEHGAVSALAAAIAHGHHRNFVCRCFLGDGKGCAGRQWLHKRCALAFEAFVAFDAACCVVAGFTLFKREFDAVDTTARIDQLEVVHIAVGPWHAIGCVRTRAVGQHRNKLRLGLSECIARCENGCTCGHHGNCEYEFAKLHLSLLKNNEC